MTREQVKKFKELAEKYGLTKSDFFKAPQGFVCINRTGIEKIQRGLNVCVNYEVVPVFSDPSVGQYCIKASGWIQDTKHRVESFGEASPKNCKVGYPIAMAEKRALSRVILKLADLYEIGVYGEDEVG